jgi:Coenzyme PQQ synthesis protein D (PqqD)
MKWSQVERLMQGPGVLAQPDIRLYGVKELTDAIRDADDVAPDETVLVLSFEHGLYELNSAGAVLWDALKSPHSIPELEELLSTFFGIQADQAASDVGAFVTELQGIGLIRTLSS